MLLYKKWHLHRNLAVGQRLLRLYSQCPGPCQRAKTGPWTQIGNAGCHPWPDGERPGKDGAGIVHTSNDGGGPGTGGRYGNRRGLGRRCAEAIPMPRPESLAGARLAITACSGVVVAVPGWDLSQPSHLVSFVAQ